MLNNDTKLVDEVQTPICSIVIPTKNGGDLFHKAIAAWAKQTLWEGSELIVVDSGSQDDTVAVAKQAGANVFEIPPSEFNHGATRDYGISLASSEYIILTVQDAVPEHNRVLELLVSALKAPAVGGAYARQIAQPDADVLTKRNLGGWSTERVQREDRFIPNVDWYQALSPMEKHLLCGFDNVCSALKKSVWQQEQFGRIDFGEDIDWSQRVLLRGHHIIYEPEATVVHSHDRSLLYDYKRTYVCHRKLYSMYKLHLATSLKVVWRCWLSASMIDMLYILRNEPRLLKKIQMLLKIPILNWLTIYGQYKAVQDELHGITNEVKGI
jgi:rhamnosyltransferase